MKPNKALRSFLVVLLSATILSTGCGSRTADEPGISGSGPMSGDSDEIDWGREVRLEEMIAMAQSGQIREIQWHVMPNILRAQASDDGIFHLRNENKGVDLRNALIEAGVRIGKDGVRFRHVF